MAGPAPWSAFPAATIVHNATTFAQVEGGVNQKLTRTQLLTASAGEQIALRGNVGGVIGVNENGHIQIFAANGQGIALGCDGGSFASTAGVLTIAQGTIGGFLIITNHQNNHLVFSENLVELLIQPGSALTCTYHPAFAGNWAGGVTDLVVAIDRLAAAVRGLLGFPIP